MILTAALGLPMLGALVLAISRRWTEATARLFAIVVSVLPVLLLAWVWLQFDPQGALFQSVEEVPWVPSLGMGYRLGVDGIALAVATMSAVVFAASIAYPVNTKNQPRQYYAWMLFLQSVSLGVFLALDLLLFYVFFDLSLVGMFFLIGRWGHGQAQLAAFKFFLYTFCGSLLLLLAIIGLYLSVEPHTFDMRVLIEQQPLAGAGVTGGLVFLALMLGFAIKTPVVPVHTWLPQAHVDAPGPASAILAGVLLKMGAYGIIRIPFSMMTETFSRYALVIALLAVVSILYGAFVALGQKNLKRRIAYTSINHMGYTVLGIAVAGALVQEVGYARELALVGATVEMVAHGLITGALFLICGSFWQRTEEYDLDSYGGLLRQAPLLTAFAVLASFASLGLPGLAGFVAEFHIFVGTFGVYPWLAVIGVLGILVTAALFLQMLQKLFFGTMPQRWDQFEDLHATEWGVLAVLSAGFVIIGVAPQFLLTLIEASATLLVGGH
ncbi:complex I subunit 4 family protein [Salinicola sp. V024]|uniref:complex I subunit 4 family protein n=1 Tax=Salinicola sp. V024 TaxID=3459609 RepID=UPI0040443AFF